MTTVENFFHPIYFDTNCFPFLNSHLALKKYSKIVVLADEITADLIVPAVLSEIATTTTIEIIEIETGEKEKNINTCIQLWEALQDIEADKKTLLLNVGGGVVCDLGGFIAATFKRGISFINMPTTLLAMVDAAIGGKNGIDLGNIKNQIGTLYYPEAVLINTEYLDTLPENQWRSGFAEMLKHGLIYDKKHWNKLIQFEIFNKEQIKEQIKESVNIKCEIVKKDPEEKNIRKALNFGHTLGHAIESYFLNTKPILHGEAIACGIVLESYLSSKKISLNNTDLKLIKATIQKYFKPIDFSKKDILEIYNLLIFDKKNENGIIQFVTLNEIGNIEINQTFDFQDIEEAFEFYKN